MNESTSASIEVVKAEQHLLSAKIERDASGLSLTVKSALFEEHFKNISRKDKWSWGNHTFYVPATPPVTRTSEVSLMSEPDHGLYHGDKVNISFLRTVGIGNGVTIKLPGGVYSKERLQKWLELFKDGAKTYYLQVIKPVSMSVEISTREI